MRVLVLGWYLACACMRRNSCFDQGLTLATLPPFLWPAHVCACVQSRFSTARRPWRNARPASWKRPPSSRTQGKTQGSFSPISREQGTVPGNIRSLTRTCHPDAIKYLAMRMGRPAPLPHLAHPSCSPLSSSRRFCSLGAMQCNAMQCNATQCIQRSAMQCNTVRCNAIQC